MSFMIFDSHVLTLPEALVRFDKETLLGDSRLSLLRCLEVRKSFGGTPVVAGSLSLKAGQQLVLVGPSGCGKSTLLHLILTGLVQTLGSRTHEFAILRALGMSRRRLFSLLVVESSLLAAAGSLLGFCVYGLILGVAAGLLPAWKACTTPVAENLSRDF